MLIGVRKRTVFLAYILVSLSLLIFIPLTPAMNSAVHENSKSGPFVSRILWSRSSFEDNTYQEKDILDLLNNEIDLFENQLEFDYIQELEAAEGIQVIHTPFNGFTHLSINCAKYPLNISAFRRAIAFSLDKERIADEIWGGQARVHDSVVPPVSHWSVEEQLNPHYYNGASDIGNSLLAEAGFYDIDADGYREAPDGSDFDVWLVFPPADVSQEANQCGWLVVLFTCVKK